MQSGSKFDRFSLGILLITLIVGIWHIVSIDGKSTSDGGTEW